MKRNISIMMSITLIASMTFGVIEPTYASSYVETAFENNVINESLIEGIEDSDELFCDEGTFDEDNSLLSNIDDSVSADANSGSYLFSSEDEIVSVNKNNAVQQKDKNEITIGEFTYQIDDENLTASVIGWSGTGKATIPSKITLPENSSNYASAGLDRKVNSIGEKAFENKTELTEIEFADTITYIDSKAFSGCTSITSVTFPEIMNYIGNEAFSGCTALSSVQLPDKLNGMGGSVFKGCSSFKSIMIPQDIDLDEKKVSTAGPFNGADNLTEITFESGIKKVPDRLFTNCNSIKSIDLPSPISTIGIATFSGCKNLETITMPNTLIEIKEGAFQGCVALKKIESSPNLKWIRQSAFAGCNTLSECSIPDNVREIGKNAFNSCKGLYTVTFFSGDDAGYEGGEIGENAFYDCESLSSIIIPNSIVSIGKTSFKKCSKLSKMHIEDLIKDFTSDITIKESAFEECKSLADVSLSNHLAKIEKKAFYKCEVLPKIIFPDSVKEIGESAFENCIKLADVTLSKGLTTLGPAVFRNDVELIGITIPKSLKTIDIKTNKPYTDGVFYGCQRFKNIEFETGIDTIPANLFRGATSIEKVTIPSTVTGIGNYAFDNCNHLKLLTIPNSVISIGDYAFNCCKWLEGTDIIPNSVKTIGKYAFSECAQLGVRPGTEYGILNLTGQVEKIGDYAFNACIGINEASIPDSAEIGKGCFKACNKLAKIHLPKELAVVPDELFSGCISLSEVNLSKDKLTSIGDFAFYNCDTLKTFDDSDALDFRDYKKLTKIGKNAFQDCDTITTLLLSASTSELGEYAFDDCNSLSNISLGTGLSTIPKGAFSNLNSLVEIIIPRQVKTIKTQSFYKDPALVKIHIPKTTEIIEDNVFSTYKVLTICGYEPSPAYEYAKARGINWLKEIVYVKSMKFVEKKMMVNEGATVEPVLEVEPVHYSVDIEYTSEKPEIFTVEIKNGKCVVKGVSKGSANLVALATADESGAKTQAVIPIEVRRPVKSVSVAPTTLTIDTGTKAQLKATLNPADPSDPTIIWSSADEKIAYVDKDGVVYGKTKGKVVITATSKDNDKASAKCTVTVNSEIKDAPESWSKVLEKPTADPAGGDLTRGTTVTLSSIAAGSCIYYTTNGSEPVADYEGRVAGDTKLYTGPISITKNMTLKAFAICPGYKYSPVAEFTYTVDDGWGDIDDSLRGRFSNNTGSVPDDMWFAFKGDEKIYQEGKDTGVVKVYTGEKITFNSEVYVFNGFSRLVEDRDYKLTFKNNTEPASVGDSKSPLIMVKGKGNYKGKSEFRFTISKVDMKSVVITSGADIVVLAGKPVNSAGISAVYNGNELKVGDDYTITYYKGSIADANKIDGNTAAAEGVTYYAELTAVTGSKYYKGSRSVTIKVAKGAIPMSEVSAPSNTAVGWSKDLDVKKLFDNTSGSAPIQLAYNNANLKYGIDFTVTDIDKNAYPDYPDAGSYSVVVKGAGTAYVGTKAVRFKINGVDKADVVVNGLNNKPVYTGSIITRNDLGAFTLENKATGAKLDEGTDYVVDMSKAVSNGKFEVLFKLKGGYQGIKKVNVRVIKADLSGISDSDVKVGKAVYSKAGTKPAVSVTYKGKILREGVDYTLTYSNNKNASSGKSPMVNLKGKGCFKGKKSVAFSIEKSSIARLSLSVADVKFTAGKTGSYYKKVPKVMDGEKAVSKKKDVTAFNKTNCVFKNAITGAVLGDNDPVTAGTIIQVQVTLSAGTNGMYEGKDVVLTGDYKVIDPAKDIKKAKVKDIGEVNYCGGSEIVLVKGTDFKVYMGDSATPLDPKFYEIVSISNRNLIGKSTVTIRGVGEYGGLKKFKIKIKAKKF